MSELTKVELIELDTATLTGTYQDFGSASAGPVYKVQFINPSNVACYITDGTSEYRIGAEGTVTLDEVYMRNTNVSAKYQNPKGTQFQIKQVTAAGVGTIWGHLVVDR